VTARRAPRPASAAVVAVVLALTAVLTVLAWQANARSEQRLLDRQLAQVGTLLTDQAAVLQTELANIGQVAVNTTGRPDAFARFAGKQLTETGQSLTLWRISGGHAEQLAVQGVPPRLPPGRADALAALQPTGQLVVLGVLRGSPDRLTYAVMPADGNTDLVVYAESPLPSGRMPATPNSPVAGLDLAMYLGAKPDPARLLEETAPTPIHGHSRTLTVPFGSTSVTVVGASPTPLTGALSHALPWMVAGVGVLLAAGGGLMVEILSRRRTVAERLATENAGLYRVQRSIAGTLQRALLPEVPDISGLQIAARYAAGVDELQVGGDWFDVIERRPGSVVFVVGDVSGRGLPAATTMAALRFAVRGFVSDGDSIEAVLSKLRRLLTVDVQHQFATVLLGELDLPRRRMRLVSAGHFPPILTDAGQARLLDCPPAPPVGVPAPPATAVEVALPRAGTLLAYTDGAVERRGEVIDVGVERLRTAAEHQLTAADPRPLDESLDAVLATVTVADGKDDTVLLGMRWTS
jgi:serine phosphatase RsbU (regulator of sigma subunit)